MNTPTDIAGVLGLSGNRGSEIDSASAAGADEQAEVDTQEDVDIDYGDGNKEVQAEDEDTVDTEEPPEPDEDANERLTNQILYEQIQALGRQLSDMQAAQQTAAQKSTEPKPEPVVEPELIAFATDEEAEGLAAADPAVVNALLNKVYRHAVETARQQLRVEAPKIAAEQAARRESEAEIRRKFWAAQQDLFVGVAPEAVQQREVAVTAIASQVSSERPELSIDELIKEVNRRGRMAFGIAEKKGGEQQHRRNRPGPQFRKRPPATRPQKQDKAPQMTDQERILTSGKGYRKL